MCFRCLSIIITIEYNLELKFKNLTNMMQKEILLNNMNTKSLLKLLIKF